MDEIFGTVIHACTRANLIEDGDLVDVSERAKEAGITIPTAVTRAVWEACCEWTVEDETKTGFCQDTQGRLWDVLWMLRTAIKTGINVARPSGNDQVILYTLFVQPRPGVSVAPLVGYHPKERNLVVLKAIIGPGDTDEPVFTILQVDED